MFRTIEINTDAIKSACDAVDKCGKAFHHQMERMNQTLSESLEPLGQMNQALFESMEQLKRNNQIMVESLNPLDHIKLGYINTDINKQLRHILKTTEYRPFRP